MGFYQEIISMFIQYWVPLLYILGRFCILEAKFWAKKCNLLWQKFDGILPKNHINAYCNASYTGCLLLYLLGRFCILGAKIWAKKCNLLWHTFDGILPKIISMFIQYWVPLLYILGPAILHTGGQNLGQKMSLSFGKNLMGFYQEIISMFILYWVPPTLFTGAILHTS
jgi:hypothetical protein